MSSAELEEKQRQLDDLQRSFNEYVESSKELEAELETALEDAAEKIDRAAEREAAAQRKAQELQSKVDELTRAQNNKPRDSGKAVDNEDLLIKHRRLENENEDLQNQVRILEASVEDLNHRVQGLEEDTIFLKTDIEAITLARDELEVEMNNATDALQKKLDISEADRRKLSADIAAMTKKMLDDPAAHDPNDDKVQMLLFKQDKDIDFIKSTLDALAVENSEAHRHGHHDHHSPMWHEKVEELRTKLRETEQEKHALSEEVFELQKQLERQMHAAENFYKREHFEELEQAFQESEHERTQLLEELSETEQKLAAAEEALSAASEKEKSQYPEEVVTELEKKLQASESAADELAAQVATLQKHLEALIPEAQVADELRDLSAQQQHELAQQSAKLEQQGAALEEQAARLRELEAIKHDLEGELDTALKEQATPKFQSVGSYVSNVSISSATHSSVIEISSISTTHVTVTEVINSGDIGLMKAELMRLAQQYDTLRNSNTRMLNKLQALQGNIQVCCRTRPPSYQELAQGGKVCIDAADDTELMCYDGRSEAWKSFFFDRVWKADANQAEVFADIEPMVISVLDGYNACILAYGQTGSGKTFTMDGYGDQYGANYRTIQRLFDQLILRKVQAEAHANRVEQLSREATASNKAGGNGSKRKSAVAAAGSNTSDETDDTNSVESVDEESPFTFSLTVSMMEIYNEQVYDLLGVSGGQSAGSVSLDIRQGADNSVSVPGLQQMTVHSLQDVMSVFSKGTANRATAATNLNEHSSRSHLIVQVDVTTQRGADTPVKGRLNLVDLAGSERVGKSGATGTTMKEAQHINKSLSALGDVMEALDQKSKHIPYRNSKLTYLLQNSLGGNSRTMMIVTVCPTDLTFEESLFTLQFATRVRNITVGPAQKQSNAKNLEATMKTLRAEMKELKRSKLAVDEQLLELKKEQKKVPAASLMEAKLKTIEEARKAGEILMQQLNRQITECNVKLSDEKELKEQLTAELALAQKNLKKALEQIRELTKANERLEMQLKQKEHELESAPKLHSESRDSSEEAIRTDKPLETPAPATRPPPAPTSGPSRGINSSARRINPASGGATSLSAPVRKPRPSVLKEFMLPTASSVAHVVTSHAEHEAHSEEVANATHGPLTQALPPKRSASPMVRHGSFASTINTNDVNSLDGDSVGLGSHRRSSWQDVLAPTASRQAHIQAAEAEQAAKAQSARQATHAGNTRMSISPAPRRETDDGGSVNTSRMSLGESHFVNPKGHSSWQDAMAPTAARMAALSAAEEEFSSRNQSRVQATHPPGNRFSVSPASSRGRGEPRADDESVTSARLSNEYAAQKGHSSWQDAMAPTVARKAALTAQEEEYARRAKESAQATHAVGLGRFTVSPARSRWDAEEEAAPKEGLAEYANPKGHSSWVDAMAPTASRQAAIAAAEAEQYGSESESRSPSNGVRPWVPASKDPGRPPQPHPSELCSDPVRPTRPSTSASAPAHDSSVSRRGSTSAGTPTSTTTAATAASAAKRTPAANSSKAALNDSSNSGNGGALSLLASSSMVRRTAVSTETTNTVRMSSLSVRSEEAMKRHQMRMDKRREMTAAAAANAPQPLR